jgi:hypothetical protein
MDPSQNDVNRKGDKLHWENPSFEVQIKSVSTNAVILRTPQKHSKTAYAGTS